MPKTGERKRFKPHDILKAIRAPRKAIDNGSDLRTVHVGCDILSEDGESIGMKPESGERESSNGGD
jgi:hypothetical protein